MCVTIYRNSPETHQPNPFPQKYLYPAACNVYLPPPTKSTLQLELDTTSFNIRCGGGCFLGVLGGRPRAGFAAKYLWLESWIEFRLLFFCCLVVDDFGKPHVRSIYIIICIGITKLLTMSRFLVSSSPSHSFLYSFYPLFSCFLLSSTIAHTTTIIINQLVLRWLTACATKARQRKAQLIGHRFTLS